MRAMLNKRKLFEFRYILAIFLFGHMSVKFSRFHEESWLMTVYPRIEMSGKTGTSNSIATGVRPLPPKKASASEPRERNYSSQISQID